MVIHSCWCLYSTVHTAQHSSSTHSTSTAQHSSGTVQQYSSIYSVHFCRPYPPIKNSTKSENREGNRNASSSTTTNVVVKQEHVRYQPGTRNGTRPPVCLVTRHDYRHNTIGSGNISVSINTHAAVCTVIYIYIYICDTKRRNKKRQPPLLGDRLYSAKLGFSSHRRQTNAKKTAG